MTAATQNETLAEVGLELDRSDWELVSFGDVAKKQNASVDRENTDLTRYVAGEHMGSEDLHLREWGDIGDDYLGPAFTRKFEKGDILYGSRRTYLRKVAVAHFDGITANTTFVIKPNKKLIHPQLLPFILLSEGFAQHSIRNSKGSVNPYINWKDIANYEFLLPPKDQQAKLAELLWAADGDVESLTEAARKLDTYRDSLRDHLVFEGIDDPVEYSVVHKRNISKRFVATTIGKMLDEGLLEGIQDGNHGELHPKSSQYVPEGIPFIMANTLISGRIDLSNAKRLPQKVTDGLRIGFAKPRDVLLSHKGTIGETAIVPTDLEFPYLMLTPQVTYYRCNESALLPDFLLQAFKSAFFQEQLRVLSSQSTRSYIGITSQRNLKIAIPKDIKSQKAILSVIDKSEMAVQRMREKVTSSADLLKSLINQIF